MAIHVEELNATNCKTYLLVSGNQAILVDPVRERIETYRKVLIQRDLALTAILETHTHADHLMFNRELIDSLDAPVIMHTLSPSPLVSRHVEHGEEIGFGDGSIKVLHSPGHTLDSVCYVVDGAVLTGDTMLIGGSGRTDFPGGDAGAQYDAVTGMLFTMPEDTIVWPAHDYKGQTSSTIGAEKAGNARFSGRSRAEYVEVMGNLGLPFPVRIQQALQVNQSGFESHEVLFPTVADIAATEEVEPHALAARIAGESPPIILDVREPEEFVGELGHIEGALLVPLDTLQRRLPKLHGYSERTVVVACRAGARSASACALLRNAGFSDVLNLAGGMLAWADAELTVQR